ncbi:conserved hypothetical protein [Mesorhizobium delmotii]|uniref:Uncharacterized protein n=1 Tax=Mesorhizobium delmotii TaxID=1631247 RepID=A0A2P9AMT8_9HYPH|nr:conserved hypothetical protein [Mesorhizobium delmotii]
MLIRMAKLETAPRSLPYKLTLLSAHMAATFALRSLAVSVVARLSFSSEVSRIRRRLVLSCRRL